MFSILVIQAIYQGEYTMKKIAVMPDAKHQTAFKEDEMTKFIKENMKANIPDYDSSRHPDPLRNMIRLLLFASPFIALIMYFLTRPTI